LHISAVTQVRNDTPGRAYYLRKMEEGKSKKEAMRALKRKISDAVYRQLVLDAAREWDLPQTHLRALARWTPSRWHGAFAPEPGQAA